MTRRTIRDIKGTMFLSSFTVPQGTKVRALTAEEFPMAPTFGTQFVVVDPLRAIPECQHNLILRHDLTHRYIFVPEWATERV